MKRYTSSHEWIEVKDGIGTCGITEHAQQELGDIVYVELPEEGRTVAKGEDIVVLESTKAAADVYAPISGTVASVNEALADAPETVNTDAEGKGWLFTLKISEQAELESLMDESAYKQLVQG